MPGLIKMDLPQGAIFSDDRRYRYALWRRWDDGPALLLIGLNPSKANEVKNDPTITRGIRRARESGFSAFLMGNLYAYVSTDPKVLLGGEDFVGEWNDYYLRVMIRISSQRLCGWGSFKPVSQRAPAVLAMISEPYCLGINADGQPKHPLYVSYATPMERYVRRSET
jgi:hypothetical protein